MSVVLLTCLAVLVGFVLAHASLAEERRQVDEQRRLLEAEYQFLDAKRHTREVFLQARRAMTEEVWRQMPGAGRFYRRRDEQP